MIELFERDIVDTRLKSSKGNQLKWKTGNMWYKADCSGYEGLSEVIASRMLQYSDLESEEYVKYDIALIKYKSTVFNGCKSADFIQKGSQLITLERLYENFCGQSLHKTIYKIQDCRERFDFLIYQLQRITGLSDFSIYLNKILTIDALCLNEDRHMHNIALILKPNGDYAYCPIFDQGAGLLSDTTMDYPLGEDVYRLIDSVKSKTLVEDFDEQLDVSERASRHKMNFHFTKNDVRAWLKEEEIAAAYNEEIRDRVEKIVLDRMRRYQYLFEY